MVDHLPELNVALGTYGHTVPLKTGAVPIAGFRAVFPDVSPTHEIFRRMIQEEAFDVAEMALTTYLVARFYGKPLVALPVMPMRMFHHGTIWCRAGRGIRSPKDLEGRRVAVRSYAQTGPMWSRGILQTAYGVDLDRIEWVTFEGSHVPECPDPPNASRASAGDTMRAMLEAGEVDAAISLESLSSGDVRPLFADAARLEADWFTGTGIYPINHLVVVRADLAAQHPELPATLFEAMARAKRIYLQQLAAEGPANAADEAIVRVGRLVGGDPLPFGVGPNRLALDTAADFVQRQKIIPVRYAAAEIFPAELSGLSG
ncbi:ABC transporter substrate-binding protein [Pseudochelatococcus sp. B33]